jgi:hypothetical protein
MVMGPGQSMEKLSFRNSTSKADTKIYAISCLYPQSMVQYQHFHQSLLFQLIIIINIKARKSLDLMEQSKCGVLD